MSEYSEQFKDPRWQRFRLEIFERDKFKCVRCENAGNTLHAHHLFYVKGRKPWEYHPGCIITLCDNCHEFEHIATKSNPSKWECVVGMSADSDYLLPLLIAINHESLCSGISVEEMIDSLVFSIQSGELNLGTCVNKMQDSLDAMVEEHEELNGAAK